MRCRGHEPRANSLLQWPGGERRTSVVVFRRSKKMHQPAVTDDRSRQAAKPDHQQFVIARHRCSGQPASLDVCQNFFFAAYRYRLRLPSAAGHASLR